MAGQWLRTACAVSVTAWAVATPVTMYHWGVFWPWAALFSLLALPVVAALLAVGYAKMLLAVVLPSAASLLGVPLSFCAEVLISLVEAMDAVPWSVIQVPHPSVVWTGLALAWIFGWVTWGMSGGRRNRRRLWLAGAVLLVWFLWPALPEWRPPALRIDMLAVGNGSCYVLRSGASAIVFDAGSSTDLDAGRRSIVPALRRLGIRSLDALVISHPNLDHYSAVLETADAFRVRSVLVTPQLVRAAAADPYGPVAFVLDGLTDRFVAVSEVADGDLRTYGSSRWRWLHPGPRAGYARANDGSMVIRIEAAGRAVLLCGDIQREAIQTLLGDGRTAEALAADIVELPHHGGHHELAEAFLDRVQPEVVMQSTGPTQWRRTQERWVKPLTGVERLVTARDGACWVEIGRAGTITFGRFRDVLPEGFTAETPRREAINDQP
jgi:competence protein ComEC